MNDLLAHFTAWNDSARADNAMRNPVQNAPAAGNASESFETALAAAEPSKAAEPQELSAWDLLDIINPLQHIPLVSDLYRAATGDTIRPEIQLAGSTAIGGVLGFAAQLGKMVFEAGTGQSMGDAIATAFTSTDTAPAKEVAAVHAAPVMEVASAEIQAQALAPIPTAFGNAYPTVDQAFSKQAAYNAYMKAAEATSQHRHTL